MEGLDEKREEALEHSHMYRQRMVEAYVKTMKKRLFAEGELVLRTVEHIWRGLAGPSKFLPKWERSFVIREVNASGYYCLAKMDGSDLMDPINGK